MCPMLNMKILLGNVTLMSWKLSLSNMFILFGITGLHTINGILRRMSLHTRLSSCNVHPSYRLMGVEQLMTSEPVLCGATAKQDRGIYKRGTARSGWLEWTNRWSRDTWLSNNGAVPSSRSATHSGEFSRFDTAFKWWVIKKCSSSLVKKFILIRMWQSSSLEVLLVVNR